MVHKLLGIIAASVIGKIIWDTLPTKFGIKELWGYGRRTVQYIGVLFLVFVAWLKVATMSKQQAAQREQQFMVGVLFLLILGTLCIIYLQQKKEEQKKLNPPTA